MNSVISFISAPFLFALISMQSGSVFYNGEAAMPPGWKFQGWKGVETSVTTAVKGPNGGSCLEMAPSEDVKSWAGARYCAPKGGIPTDQVFWEKGFLNLRLSMEQDGLTEKWPLQVGVMVQLKNGTTVRSKHVRVNRYKVDAGDVSSWLTVSIPLREMTFPKEVVTDLSAIANLGEIIFQYSGNQTVLAKTHIAYISLNTVPLGKENDSTASTTPPATPSLFRSFADLHPPYLLPRNVPISVDAYGNFTYQGQPRFLIGAEMGCRLQQFPRGVEGYPPELKWIYEKPLDYENAQRLGIDSVGIFIPPLWQAQWDVQPAINTMMLEQDGSAVATEKVLRELGLPVYVDLSLIPTLNGVLTQSGKIPAEAKNAFAVNNHYTQYTMLHPAGRELYRALFRGGAEMMMNTNAKALYYELLNEPAYDDPSPYNRNVFVQAMEKKYGNINELNRTWGTHYQNFQEIGAFRSQSDTPGLFVEWCKFMEDTVTGLCREGASIIRKVDPSARFAVQIMGEDYYRVPPKSNANIFQLSKDLEVVSLPTGGGIENPGSGGLSAAPGHTIDAPQINHRFEGMVSRHFFLELAVGKPIVDGEFYAYHHPFSDGFWLQLVRGGNAAYIFSWTKREFDWKPDRGARGGHRLAEIYPYNILNPYALAPNQLADIAKTKEEILGLNDLFVPRQNHLRPKVALLLSLPTARYSVATGSSDYNLIRAYGVAMDFAHYDYAGLVEEQLVEGKLNGIEVLVAPGVSNVLDGTLPLLQKWVAAGGTLVLALDAMQKDEWGRPQNQREWLGLEVRPATDNVQTPLKGEVPRLRELPGEIQVRLARQVTLGTDWKALGSASGQPALWVRQYGKGRIYYLNVKMGDYALAGLLGGILSECKINPITKLLRADNGELEVNVEAHVFSASGLTGIFLYNWDSYAKKFTMDCAAPALVDPLNHLTFPVKDGKALLWLPPQSKRILVAGNSLELEKRFGAMTVQDGAAVNKAMQAIEAKRTAKTAAATLPPFSIEGAKALTIDLRPFMNRNFKDSVPGDGKGGWTDEGENSLHGEEWGRQIYRGVPFDIVRPDMNGDNGVIVLASKNSHGVPNQVTGIPIGKAEKIRCFYFLHDVGRAAPGEDAFFYVLHHDDGSTTKIPVRVRQEVGDWWLTTPSGNRGKDISFDTRVAWKNFEDRGFWVYRWVNPLPKKAVTKLDIISAGNASVPIVVAISAELE